MKRLLLAAAAVLCLIGVTACGIQRQNAADQTDPAIPEITEAPTPTPKPTPTPEPTPTPTPEPVLRSITSGREITAQTTYHPVIVSIENSEKARPQTGLTTADVVYEFAVESSITRFQCLYNDVYPAYCGPVRSTRYYLLNMQHEWNCMYVHAGYVYLKGSKYAVNSTKSAAIVITPGTKTARKYFERIREDGRATEHTLYLHLPEMVEANWGEHVASQYADRFHFMPGITYLKGQPATHIGLPFETDNSTYVEYFYDAASNLWLRSQSGEEFMNRTPSEDSTTYETERVAVQNLIIQYCEYGRMSEAAQANPKGRRTVELFGTGKCDYFVNGLHLTGYWERPDVESPTTYYLDEQYRDIGDIVTLEPGNTWIAVQPTDAAVIIE